MIFAKTPTKADFPGERERVNQRGDVPGPSAPKQAVMPPLLKKTTSESTEVARGDCPPSLASGCLAKQETCWNLPWLLEVTARDRAQLGGKLQGAWSVMPIGRQVDNLFNNLWSLCAW